MIIFFVRFVSHSPAVLIEIFMVFLSHPTYMSVQYRDWAAKTASFEFISNSSTQYPIQWVLETFSLGVTPPTDGKVKDEWSLVSILLYLYGLVFN
jgi:hypothetical protein